LPGSGRSRGTGGVGRRLLRHRFFFSQQVLRPARYRHHGFLRRRGRNRRLRRLQIRTQAHDSCSFDVARLFTRSASCFRVPSKPSDRWTAPENVFRPNARRFHHSAEDVIERIQIPVEPEGCGISSGALRNCQSSRARRPAISLDRSTSFCDCFLWSRRLPALDAQLNQVGLRGLDVASSCASNPFNCDTKRKTPGRPAAMPVRLPATEYSGLG